MFDKLRIIWLVITGRLVGESNEPRTDSYIRNISIEKSY